MDEFSASRAVNMPDTHGSGANNGKGGQRHSVGPLDDREGATKGTKDVAPDSTVHKTHLHITRRNLSSVV